MIGSQWEMKESDLAQIFIDYFDGYEIFKEVPTYNGIVDFVAVQKPILIAVEVKLAFNLRVIEQAYLNIYTSNYSYVAVPAYKNGSFKERICLDFGVGVLRYTDHGWTSKYKIEEVVFPRLNRQIIKPELKEYMKLSVAGSQNKRVTKFGNTANNLREYVKINPGVSLGEAIKNIEWHYHNISSAKSNLYQWLYKGIIKGVRYEKGKLFPVSEQKEN